MAITLRQVLAVAVPVGLAISATAGVVYNMDQGTIAKEKADKEKAQKDAQYWHHMYDDNPKTAVLEDIVAHLNDQVPVEKTTVAFKALQAYVSPKNWDVANLSLEKSNISVNINNVGGSTVDTHLVYNNGTSINLSFNLTPDQTRNAVAAAQGYVNGQTRHVFIEPQINTNSLSVERHVDVSDQATLANKVGLSGQKVTNVVAKLNKEDGRLSYSFVVDGKEQAADRANVTIALNYLEDHDMNAKGFTSLVDALDMGTQVWQTAFNVGHLAGHDQGFGQGWNASLNNTEDYLLGQIAKLTGENKSVVLDRIAGKENATLADVNETALWGEAYFQSFTQGFNAGDNSGKSVADFLYKNFNGSEINGTIKAKFADKSNDLYNASQWNRTNLLLLTYDLGFGNGNNSGVSFSVDQLEQILTNHGTPKDLNNKDPAAAGNDFWTTVFNDAYAKGVNETITHDKINGMNASHFANIDDANQLTSDVNWWLNTAQNHTKWGYNAWVADHSQKNYDALMNWSNNASVNASLKQAVMKAYASGHDIYFMDTNGNGLAGGYIANMQNGKAVGGWIAPQEQVDKGLGYKPK
jgi:hypothetical protein